MNYVEPVLLVLLSHQYEENEIKSVLIREPCGIRDEVSQPAGPGQASGGKIWKVRDSDYTAAPCSQGDKNVSPAKGMQLPWQGHAKQAHADSSAICCQCDPWQDI